MNTDVPLLDRATTTFPLGPVLPPFYKLDVDESQSCDYAEPRISES